ncbi:putative leucine-rich repeat-containing protein DDB_G0290503 isoform X2 [Oppia nitens]|uniref:putative leucine-rich repeat-containing protein DDB_G0290503 isoform X2 n=1 Tax=Oppia nitens TaxID=1686743 RepID=UPI0023DBE9E1|nr:putative leucine-rich repeat-containing protein DDB_G0290503 isoform X2 [Oppia nitens]
MGCFFSIFRFGTYVIKESDNPNATQVNIPEIRKHSSTPLTVETTSLTKQQKAVKSVHSPSKGDRLQRSGGDHQKVATDDINKKSPIINNNNNKEKQIFKTTFETQIDAPPPHPLEERLLETEEIEIDTNLYAPEVEDAAIKIQAGLRGYLARKQVKEIKESINDLPVVPPPKHFDDTVTTATTTNTTVAATTDDSQPTLSPLSDLAKWKKLSQHLEEIVADDNVVADNNGKQQQQEEEKTTTTPVPLPPPPPLQLSPKKLAESVIPLKDDNGNKTIETYVCKENILDVVEDDNRQLSDQTVVTLLKAAADKAVVDKVFDVLMAETEFENIIDIQSANDSGVDVSTDRPPLEETNNELYDCFTQESQVLAELNDILDNNERVDQQKNLNTSLSKSKAAEIVSENTTQEIIRNSFHEFIKEMTRTTDEEKILIDDKPLIDTEVIQQLSADNTNIVEKTTTTTTKRTTEERKTDSTIFEEHVVQSIFDEEMIKSQAQTQIFAIELFKNDLTDEQLQKVTTITEPEENKKNIEDRIYKTSVDEFVIKPVADELQSPVMPTTAELVDQQTEVDSEPETSQSVTLETEQKIDVIVVSESRKHSVDSLLGGGDGIDDNLELQSQEMVENETIEVMPLMSPIIQIEEQNGRILDEEEAAIRIQAAFRGFQIRRSMSREASPNRNNSNHNHNNTDEVEINNFDDNDSQLIYNAIHTAIPYQTTDPIIVDNSNDESQVPVSDQLEESLEQLEDQLMQQLISDIEQDKSEPPISVVSQETTDLLIDTSELSAPLLLQRIQQSMIATDSPSPTPSPEAIAIEAQTLPTVNYAAIEVIHDVNDEIIAIEDKQVTEDKPLIEKSDTIIADLLASNAESNQKTVDIINSNDSQPQQPNQKTEFSNEILDINQQLIETQENKTILTDLLQNDNELISESVEQIVQNTVEPLIQLSVDQTIEEPVVQNVELLIEQTVVNTVEEPIIQTIEQTVEEPIVQSIEQTVEEPVVQSIEQTVEEPIVQTIEKTVEESVVQTNEQTVEESVVQITEQTDEEPIIQIIESSLSTTTTNSSESSHESPATEKLLPLTISKPEFESFVEPPTPSDEIISVSTTLSSSSTESSHQQNQESNNPLPVSNIDDSRKPKSGSLKKPKPILKETDPNIQSLINEEMHSTSEEISSPDDDNPEFVGLGPNTPIPVRASSPNPFGKKRRRGKKGGNRK